jgi:DNA topoisomerase-1
VRDQNKFEHMAAFGRALPAIRAALDEDLATPGLSHDKVLATAVRLLELTLIRVGNDEYAKANKSFGLTTLRNRHVRADGSRLVFDFTGKSGVKHTADIRDRRLARIVKRLQDLPGQRLFQYVDEEGRRHQIGSADVNAYIRRRSGADFTAKDFRTWAGTLAAAKALATHPRVESQTQIKAATAECVKLAAALLGNTPAVCRSAYIHPFVIETYACGGLPAAFATAQGELLERAVLRFLSDARTGGGA